MKSLKRFLKCSNLNESAHDVFKFEGQVHRIEQKDNGSEFGIRDARGSWNVLAMGEEFDPESFGMSVDEMLEFIDDAILKVGHSKTVTKDQIRKSDFSEFFQSEIYDEDIDVPFDKFYVLAKLHCGRSSVVNYWAKQ